mmetsp:Transcript_28238/g.13076  ORF Transcript_28238/g.13076 Transcript_28238/m.13076 type:complete len:135 (-) Transcript_28238:736-1140(-)|eukprot:CAMPEP_0201281160 /NCGR_PEP_ID=MMETSP1317-20130820/1745_1 /ASSEMBLY_ACC=CAM_ASM_000770 /TAXON_ID=187299 /ORGANISM="Undescribed Undescribed, Strain Undescribed" /LENGTH=134 /DNA_ID=CAMNT_0047590321 /DNA_START=40 /DNA_END=444 /DNA_ORIENTATION=-
MGQSTTRPVEPLYYILGDIGGSSTRLTLESAEEDGSCKTLTKIEYPSDSVKKFSDLLIKFMTEEVGEVKATIGILAIAGIVRNNTVAITNVAWEKESGEEIAARAGLQEVKMFNDFVGMGYGALELKPDDCILI